MAWSYQQWQRAWRHDWRHCLLLREHLWRNERGAVLLEFALTLPILLIFTVFLVEMAFFWEGRILGNHTAFALGRIAKVHYDPGRSLADQSFFPDKCVLHDLSTTHGAQQQLDTAELVTAFYLFPVTRQAIGKQEEMCPSIDNITAIIDSIFQKLESGYSSMLAQLGDYTSSAICQEISVAFSKDLGLFFPQFGGFIGQIVDTIISEATEVFSDLVVKMIKPIVEAVIDSGVAVIENSSSQYLANCRAQLELALVATDLETLKDIKYFNLVAFANNAYCRYDLACQRLLRNGNSPDVEVYVSAEHLFSGNRNNTGIWKKTGGFFHHLVGGSGRVPEDSEKNALSLAHPGHAGGGEGPAAIVYTVVRYPVKSHWFSLTAALSPDNSFTEVGQIAFTSRHAVLADMPKQNIECYYYQYQTLGEKGVGVISEKIKKFVDQIGGYSTPFEEATSDFQPLVESWYNSVMDRISRQIEIRGAINDIKDFLENNNYSSGNYSYSIDGAREALRDIGEAAEHAKSERDSARRARDQYPKYIEDVIGERIVRKINPDWSRENNEYQRWRAIYTEVNNLRSQMAGFLNGNATRLSYLEIEENELSRWQDIIDYYNTRVKDELEGLNEGQTGSSKQDTIIDLVDGSDKKEEIIKRMQQQLDDIRANCRNDVHEKIKVGYFDLIENAAFDWFKPVPLPGQDSTKTFEELNKYYGTDNQRPEEIK
ncbi:MAG: TadE/TadG family type IV pilus assembly protein [Lentisphaeria bacterium]|jgi:hypothetical protein